MNALTKLALGMMGRLRPKPPVGDAASSIALPPPAKRGGLPLMEALAKRHSSREFTPDALPMQMLSDLLWAAYGVNRDGGGRTAPSALNCQEVDVFVALPAGGHRYDAVVHVQPVLLAQTAGYPGEQPNA